MRTSETLLLDFIRQAPQFRILVNQRRYAWTRRHCRQLWDHILDAGERGDVREHFLGPVMCVAAVDPLNAHWAPCLVYDGQQRLTTITLILKALAGHLKEDAALEGFEPEQIRTEYLVNPFGKGEQHYRLVLKPGDAETLLALIHDRPMPAEPSSRIVDAFAFFGKRIRQLGPDISSLCAGLRKLRIVAFHLKEGEDNGVMVGDQRGNIVVPLGADAIPAMVPDVVDRQVEIAGEQRPERVVEIGGETVSVAQNHPRTRRIAVSPNRGNGAVVEPDIACRKGLGNLPNRFCRHGGGSGFLSASPIERGAPRSIREPPPDSEAVGSCARGAGSRAANALGRPGSLRQARASINETRSCRVLNWRQSSAASPRPNSSLTSL